MLDTIAPSEFCDVALVFGRKKGHCDLALTEEGQLALDFTAATPMILSTGCDRRANPDDVLPTGVDFFNASRGALGVRRGALADIFDRQGRRTGCRIWLLDREKQDDPEPDETRRRAIAYLKEGLVWASVELGEEAVVTAEWVRPGRLAWTASVGSIAFQREI